jgi:RNA-binding protein
MLSRCNPRPTYGIFMPMPAPTSPRKQSLMPANELRRRLRAAGHALAPVVQIGKLGGTEAVRQQVERALFDHELIKMKLGSECPETRFELAARLAALPGANVVQILGGTILLYKRHPKNPQFERARTPVKKPARTAPPRRRRK